MVHRTVTVVVLVGGGSGVFHPILHANRLSHTVVRTNGQLVKLDDAGVDHDLPVQAM